jgi:uncharacterized protein YciI
VKPLFVVLRTRGPAWDEALPLTAQADWRGHAAFMDALVEEEFIRLGGPLEGTRDALLVVEAADVAEIVARLAEDPWTKSGLLTISQISPWTLRLGRI